MSLVAEVLPQVVGALQAFDPYERGVALNQLAQVRASSSNAVPGRVQRHITRAQSLALGAVRSPRRALLTWRLLPRPAACTLQVHFSRTACAPHVYTTLAQASYANQNVGWSEPQPTIALSLTPVLTHHMAAGRHLAQRRCRRTGGLPTRLGSTPHTGLEPRTTCSRR